ncbi:MAG: hypothetical protein WAN48_10220 [Actinomycetes bacterium]
MISRSVRFVGAGAAAALVVGTLVAPAALASNSDPVFVRAAASSLGGSSTSAARTAAVTHRAAAGAVARASTVKYSKTEQILQRFAGAPGSSVAKTPTTWVAAGTKQVMQVSNAGVRLLTKSTGAVVASTPNVNVFFHVTAANTTVTNPTVAFDMIGKRWILAGVATDDQGTVSTADDQVGIVVRVSKGATLKASQSSWGNPFGYAETDTVVESLPRLGITGDKVVVTTNAVDSGNATVANRIFVLPKSQLYSATLVGPNAWVSSVNSTYDGQVPAVNASSGNAAFVAVPFTIDFTVYTLTGAATTTAPAFSKSVMYPTVNLVDAPDVPQSAGTDINLPSAIDSASVAWRGGVLWAAMTVGCTPSGDTTVRACLRIMKVTTSSGVSLDVDETLSKSGYDWFTPGIAIDGAGLPHVGFDGSNVNATTSSVSSAVRVRKSNGSWTGYKVVNKGSGSFDGSAAAPVPWAEAGSAAPDPTSPQDVWVSPAYATAAGAPNWGSSITRVSLALNVAKIKPSKTKVKKGTKVTFTASLKRPGSSDGVQGLPIALQSKPKGSSKWKTLGSGTTNGSGVKKWTLKVSKTTSYRTYGKAVAQSGGQGQLVTKVYGPAVKVTVTS